MLRYLRKSKLALFNIVLGLLLLLAGAIAFASYHSKQALTDIQAGDFSSAEQHFALSQPIVIVADTVTFGMIPDLSVWRKSLSAIEDGKSLLQESQRVVSAFSQVDHSASLQDLQPTISQLQQKISYIERTLPKSWYLKNKIPEEYLGTLTKLSNIVTDLSTTVEELSEGKQTWLIIFQNTDEIRPTGGFAGSYALVHLDQGRITEIVVEDIYDADGQFEGYITAPAGIAEYTSGSRGLRLPDANWWPDFPSSAQTMLQFFAFGDKQSITGLVSVNLTLAEDILTITGPLWLPDYNTKVTSSNISEVLRAERSTFFPGSTQKKHLLEQTLTQLRLTLTQLSPSQQMALASLALRQQEENNIQFFSLNSQLEELFDRYNLSGRIGPTSFDDPKIDTCNCKPTWLMLVEANVGINKVNRYVDRQVEIDFSADALSVTTTFTNNAAPLTSTELSALVESEAEQPRNGNGYLNYYRLLVEPEYEVETITVNNQAVQTWDEKIITTATGDELRQIGILIGVAEQSTGSVVFSLRTTRETIPELLLLQHQSGLDETTYRITAPNGYTEFQTSTNTVAQLP